MTANERAPLDYERAALIRDELIWETQDILLELGGDLNSRQIKALAGAVARFLARQPQIVAWRYGQEVPR